ncbi:Lrp/AsnC family transcriptional regulator [Natrinema salifodinae]|uniref:Transcriptional regulator, AsnC family n=1 Tax=Natrinema salifodinae TaxID=1202768 RepID=A0A1I0QM92_9EURY|nr:Lrp/AsnC ligand binding domain-containing protein [Natrinema salifodinae]SEW28223.1 transcriptional regulator, AsnC family [Natrinema salifodinae]
MVRAFTMVDAATGTTEDVCHRVRELDSVVEAHAIAGDFDVIVELEGDEPHDVLAAITSEIRPLEGIGTTRTYVCLD